MVVWCGGMQLHFMATISPISFPLLFIEETRQVGIGFLRIFASLVLGYPALSFTLNLYPMLLQMAVSISYQAGGTGDMVLSVTAAASCRYSWSSSAAPGRGTCSGIDGGMTNYSFTEGAAGYASGPFS